MNKILDVAVLVGSLREDSINKKVANALLELAPAALKLSIIRNRPLADLQPGW
jgi:chromate reductase, NAD(P)H dehydrogenase (quinone)